MKKIAIYYFSLAAIVGGSLASCQDDDQGFDYETVHGAAVLREFQKNFEDRYGKIDPNHTWGFAPVTDSFSQTPSAQTRFDDNSFNHVGVVEKGWWFSKYHLAVPGADPSWGENDQNLVHGDVTKDEILYVSRFFRTFNETQLKSGNTLVMAGLNSASRVTLHTSDYFIQNISKDVDRVNADGVKDYPDGQYMRPSGDLNVNYSMDHLFANSTDHDENVLTWDHARNFNGGNTYSIFENRNDPNNTKLDTNLDDYRTILYMNASGTEDFAYHSTSSDDSHFFSEYVLMHLNFTVNGRTYDGVYLAFDYEAQKGNDHLERDHYYSNWIVKISSIGYKPDEQVRRIMCEDLGNTYDFDFNDVVFDVSFQPTFSPDQLYAVIVIRAVGGTLPIYVGYQGTQFSSELHALSGFPSTTPLNVGGATTAIDATIRIPVPNGKYELKGNSNYYTYSANPNDIEIKVINGNDTYIIGVNSGVEHIKKDGENTYNQQVIGDWKAPQKFAVPTNVRWMKENMQIEDGYTYFKNWVINESSYTDWYNTIKNGNLLY